MLCSVHNVVRSSLWWQTAGKPIDEEGLLELFQVLPLDKGCVRQAAKIHTEMARQNSDIGVKDVLIAATCLHHNLPLMTANERHFRCVAALNVLLVDRA